MLASLIIVFREVIEAGLIVGIVLAATRGVAGRGRMVAAGLAAGLAGAVLVALFAGRIEALFAGSGQELLNVTILAAAVGMLAWHNAWMSRHGRAMGEELRSLGHAVREGRRPLAALGIVIAVAVLREGSEVVLFLYGVAAGGAGAWAMAAGGAFGIAAGGFVAILMYRGMLSIPTRHIFTATSTMISLLAAGMAADAAALLQQAGFAQFLYTPLWSTAWLLGDGSIPGRMLHTLIGYTARPDGLQLLAWSATLVGFFLLTRAFAVPARRPAPASAT
ncbi:MAG: FTR1 family iron permease [Acetobacteraceae bacterium]